MADCKFVVFKKVSHQFDAGQLTFSLLSIPIAAAL